MRLRRAAIVLPESRLARNVLLIAGGSLLLAASAWMTVPMWPVPMTLQTLAVLLIGMTYGGPLAAATLAAYLAEGAVGLPVFAGGHTLLTTGPSFGYLIGFLLAATAIGALAERGWARHLPGRVATLLLGEALLYVPGLIWLNFYMHDWTATIAVGLLPFLLGDAVKLVLAALLLGRFRRLPAISG